MITTLVILTSIVVFIVAIVSPHKGTAIQRKAHELLRRIKRESSTKHYLVRWFIDIPSTISHFMVHKAAAVGKRSRWKIPF